ncbi:NAD(P)H-binding protein [Actinoallomurus sp. NPDC050550]|uniref:NAD(P)H-binding protein n=1 Tax=Actinoallomurus sp. NPDC050550 TaxID=3154937 RepID=UPI0033FBF429
MILITGATGTIGAEVVRQLAAAGERVRAMVREPSRADLPASAEVVRADFDDAPSLEHAVAGTRAVFLATAPGPAIPRHDTVMLAAARAAGVAKIVKLSAIGTTVAGEPDGPDGRGPVKVGTWHRPGEEAIRASSTAWTVLRPSDYASNTLRWARAIRAGTPVPNMTGAGAQGVIDPRDVAAVAAAVLTSPACDGRVLTLTGPEALSVSDQARLLSRALGRVVETMDVPLDVARRQMLDSGMDPAFVEVAIDGRAFVAAGRNATVTDHVERVLGRPPRTFATWAADHLHAFTA